MMEDALINAIQGIISNKEAKHIAPAHATTNEVYALVNKALNNLYASGRIDAGRTMNDRWITLK